MENDVGSKTKKTMAPDTSTFAGRLKYAMKMRGVSNASQLGVQCSMDRSYSYRLVSGRIENPHKYIPVLSEVLRVNAKWLSDGIGNHNDPAEPEPDLEPLYNAYKPIDLLERVESIELFQKQIKMQLDDIEVLLKVLIKSLV